MTVIQLLFHGFIVVEVIKYDDTKLLITNKGHYVLPIHVIIGNLGTTYNMHLGRGFTFYIISVTC